jgi:hypothetical protein
MSQVIPEYEHLLIPCELITAIQDFNGFAFVHLEYWRKYGGPYGFCTHQAAFNYLTNDLESHNLPVKYSSFQSFKSLKSRKPRL